MIRINNRFRNARITSDLSEAGVLIHQFDATEATGRAWAPCDEDQWCSHLRDRMVATLIYAGHALIWANDRAGMVLDPALAAELVLCSYPQDGGTQARTCVARTHDLHHFEPNANMGPMCGREQTTPRSTL